MNRFDRLHQLVEIPRLADFGAGAFKPDADPAAGIVGRSGGRLTSTADEVIAGVALW